MRGHLYVFVFHELGPRCMNYRRDDPFGAILCAGMAYLCKRNARFYFAMFDYKNMEVENKRPRPK